MSIIGFNYIENKLKKPNERGKEFESQSNAKKVSFGKNNVKEFMNTDSPSVCNQNYKKTTMYTKNGAKPSNFYSTDFQTPNFTSNVEDLRKFYSYEYFDTLLKKNSDLSENANNQNINAQNQTVDTSQTFNQPQTETWHYKNEIPMNGGLMGDVSGFDMTSPAFSTFGSEMLVHQKIQPSDDIRSGMGFPNQQRQIIDNTQN